MKAPARADLAIIIPAYNASALLRRSAVTLAALARRLPLIIVDAGSTDDTAEVARSLTAHVERLPCRQGPAAARNAGAGLADAEVLLFLDADCVPHDDTVERVRRAFAGDPELVSLTGSYDADPPESNFASLYMNLRHHYTHQQARQDPGTFWAGCGAVRRSAFLAVGGFDSERYPRPSVEDIELVTRLRAHGRTRLDPELQVTHLKRWTLWSVVETDVMHRAIPWARLVVATGELPDDLNTRRSQRLAVGIAPLALLALVALPASVVLGNWPLALLSALLLATSVALSGGLLRFLARTRGNWFAARAWLLHQIHLTCSGVVFGGVILLGRLMSGRTRER
jgi:hypothetical protein